MRLTNAGVPACVWGWKEFGIGRAGASSLSGISISHKKGCKVNAECKGNHPEVSMILNRKSHFFRTFLKRINKRMVGDKTKFTEDSSPSLSAFAHM